MPTKRILQLLSCFFVLLFGAATSHAQVLRAFGNTGFEIPVRGTNTACFSQIPDNVVPDWSTTHPTGFSQQNGCAYPGVTVGNTTQPLIEFWANAFQGVQAREGAQFVELSAEADTTLYQNICIVTGDTVTWQLSHRARNAAAAEEMRFVISPTLAGISSPAAVAATAATGGILQARTTTTGVTNIVSCQSGSNVTGANVCNSSTFTTANGTTWGDYSGAFTWSGASGTQFMGFGNISPAGASVGNFLDRVIVTLRPYIEFAAASSSGLESVAGATGLGIRVTGVVPTAMTVPITVTGGTAVLGTDYTTPSGTNVFNIIIPAGTYVASTVLTTGITILQDAVLEGSETINLSIGTDPNYLIANTTVCGSAPNNITTYTIIDDEQPRISVNKISQNGTGAFAFVVSNSTPAASQTITTTAANTSTSVANLTNRPITAINTAITITETLPVGSAAAGFWGASAVSCIDANGGGVLANNANPNTNIASLVGNVAAIPAANVFASSNITCTVTNVLVNAIDDVANKIVNLPSTTSVNANDVFPTGSTFTVTGGTCLAKAPASPATNTTGLVSYTSPATPGATCTVIYQVCAPAPNTTVCDTATLTVTATAPEAALVITKTDNKAITFSGATNDYVVTLTNQGPSPADGVVLTDAPGAGLTCPPANPVVCSVLVAGAVCPLAPLTIANLTAPAGITVATFPANSSLQFAFSCNVN